MLVGGGSNGGTANTAIILRSCRFRFGFIAKALPIAFRSAHKDPVGIETSIFVPRYKRKLGVTLLSGVGVDEEG